MTLARAGKQVGVNELVGDRDRPLIGARPSLGTVWNARGVKDTGSQNNGQAVSPSRVVPAVIAVARAGVEDVLRRPLARCKCEPTHRDPWECPAYIRQDIA